MAQWSECERCAAGRSGHSHADCRFLPRSPKGVDTEGDRCQCAGQCHCLLYSIPRGLRCQEGVNAYLEEPLGDRVVVDQHTGDIVGNALQPFADAQPQQDWRIVEVSGLQSQPGFSLRLPFGWEFRELQVNDSYAGEVIGDDEIRLTFEYGKSSRSLDPTVIQRTLIMLHTKTSVA